MIRFGSVCSGIEAASVAWGPLGWKAAWLAEIEPFPCAVLAHHYPDVPNLGDMTLIADLVTAGEVEAPDVLCGGTPCQSFSVAGKRASLQDARGNLSLSFCNLADTIDAKRDIRGEPACVVVWENVPGVLSTKDNAFGCFLGALAGSGDALQPPRKPNGKPDRWPDAGVVLGPRRAIAWRILDAQYFGLAQRRRRVFVVASAREGFDPAAVLLEFDGVRRDTAPRRGEGQDVAGTISSRTTGGGGLGTDFECAGGLQAVSAYGGGRTSGPVDVAACLVAKGQKCDFEVETFCVHGTQDPCVSDKAFALGRNSGQENAVFAIQAGAMRTNPLSGPDGVGVQADHAYTLEARAEVQAVCVTGDITHTLKAEGFDASEDGTGRGTPLVPVSVALRGREGGGTAEVGDDLAFTLRASDGGGDKPHVLAPVVYSIMPMNSGKDYKARETDVAQPLMAGGPVGGNQGGDYIAHPIAFMADDYKSGSFSEVEVAGPLTTTADRTRGAPIAFSCKDHGADAADDVAPTLRAMNHADSHANAGGQVAVAVDCYNGAISGDIAATLGTRGSHSNATGPQMMQAVAVRRLTPRECERLQGFPDGWTMIPWRGKPAELCPDGPRYKAIGNSWAVNVAAWLGARIDAAIRDLNRTQEAQAA